MARILLLGCGQLTSQLPQFTQHILIGFRRSRVDVSGIEMVQFDLHNPDIITALQTVGPIDAVVFTATPEQRSEAAYRAIYVDIPQRILTALHTLKWSPHWLHVSSTGVFHHNSGEYVHENTQPAPQSSYSQILRESELLIEAYGNSTILRLSGLYGQGRTHLLNSLQAGRKLQAWPWSYTNRIHREDAVRAIAFLLDKALANINSAAKNGPVQEKVVEYYHGADHDPAPLHEVGAYLAQLNHLSQPAFYELSPAQAVGSQNKRVGNRKLIQAGFNFNYPSFRAGFLACSKE